MNPVLAGAKSEEPVNLSVLDKILCLQHGTSVEKDISQGLF